jgi:hypothetical protein
MFGLHLAQNLDAFVINQLNRKNKMTPKDLKRACRLYKSYKTDSTEFRLLAEKYGMQTTDLTSKCWHVFNKQRQTISSPKIQVR